MTRRTLRATLALATSAAIALTLAPSPAFAVSAAEQENLSTVIEVGAPSFAPVDGRLPAVESLLQRGTPLAADSSGRVGLGEGSATASSALVRVTSLQAAADTTVFTGPNTPVLYATAGTTVSATALLPVTEGSVSLWSDAPGELRVEPLAYFAGGDNAPGSTIALAEPVRRADTANGLGGDSLSADPLWIGLTGEGGVPASGARSVYLTLTTDLAAPDELILSDGQQLSLPAGRSVVTTVVTLDERGGVNAQLATAGNSASLTADIQGWVSEAPMDASRANSVGSYVSTTEHGEATTLELQARNAAASLTLADHSDITYALALVSAGEGSASATTISTSAGFQGRASGTAIDGNVGALPQLALIPVENGDTALGIRRGAASVTVQPLGGFLGDALDLPRGTDDAPSITITSPLNRDEIDLSETGLFTLTGTVTAGANAIDRIEISSPEVGFIGNAELQYGDDDVTWEFTASAPDDGDFDYIATVFDRSDPGTGQAEDRVTLIINTPDADDAVVAPDVRVFNTDPGVPDFSIVSERQARFAVDPELELDTIIVSGPTIDSAEGFAGRVQSVNRTADGWLVDTTEVAMEEMFFQFDLDTTVDYDEGQGPDGQPIVIESIPDQRPASEILTGEYAVADESGVFGENRPIDEAVIEEGDAAEHAGLMTGDNVDLSLNAGDMAPEYADQFALGCRASGSDANEPTGNQFDDDGHWVPAAAPDAPATGCDESVQGTIDKTWSLGLKAKLLVEYREDKLKATNLTKTKEEEAKQKTKHALETGAAMTIEAQAQASLSLHIVFDVTFSFKWKFIPKGVKVHNFTVEVTTNLKANASLEFALFREQSLALKQDLATLVLPTTVFTVGIVPVAITNQLNVSLGIESTLKAAIKMPLIGIEREDHFGFTYSSDHNLQRIKNDPTTTYIDPALEPVDTAEGIKYSLAGEIVVGPKIEYESKIYGFAGPAITLSAGAGVEGEASMEKFPDRTSVSAAIDVFIGAGLDGKAKLKLLKWQLLSITIFEAKWRYSLFHKKWSTDLHGGTPPEGYTTPIDELAPNDETAPEDATPPEDVTVPEEVSSADYVATEAALVTG